MEVFGEGVSDEDNSSIIMLKGAQCHDTATGHGPQGVGHRRLGSHRHVTYASRPDDNELERRQKALDLQCCH
jgi:hypothetical protein